MQSKLDMAGKKPPKAFILPVATIRLTFVIGLLFIAMPLAEAVKGEGQTANQDGPQDDVAESENRIHRLTESMIVIGKSLLERLEHLEGKAGNIQNLTGYMEKMDKKFQTLTGHVMEMTGQMKWMTKDAVEALLKTADRCPAPWVYRDKRCYLFVGESKTWHSAKDYCRAKGGHLASVHTKTMLDFLHGLAGGQRPWVGGYKEGGVWKWDDGSTFSVKNDGVAGSNDARWEAGEPNNAGGKEDCMEKVPSGGLNDETCSYWRPFLCQL
ncbi:C-type lectin domain family 10 member A-like [Dunckerocampus dactyliophorus]|uniref:C-type lectin domain family 10 member A-like n=1 Tax=Dunckerocampus dactyliophorus TaxID=161453 RepID=UPI00240757ED|nr:C-type lectin domain family 10 member A-like [Dunckerocampus dactyliophorus]XP_054608824.1 C-type lectin domain family 10 member A-like [Dunckerocampus dactyliophorus]